MASPQGRGTYARQLLKELACQNCSRGVRPLLRRQGPARRPLTLRSARVWALRQFTRADARFCRGALPWRSARVGRGANLHEAAPGFCSGALT